MSFWTQKRCKRVSDVDTLDNTVGLHARDEARAVVGVHARDVVGVHARDELARDVVGVHARDEARDVVGVHARDEARDEARDVVGVQVLTTSPARPGASRVHSPKRRRNATRRDSGRKRSPRRGERSPRKTLCNPDSPKGIRSGGKSSPSSPISSARTMTYAVGWKSPGGE